MTTTTTTARERVLGEYANKDGVITQLGKFEGEPVFAPHFWDIAMDGFADSDDGQAYGFKFHSSDNELRDWPELKTWLGRKRTLRMREDGQGFVHCF